MLALLNRCYVKMLENFIFYSFLRSGYVTLLLFNHLYCFIYNTNDQLLLTVAVTFRHGCISWNTNFWSVSNWMRIRNWNSDKVCYYKCQSALISKNPGITIPILRNFLLIIKKLKTTVLLKILFILNLYHDTRVKNIKSNKRM